MSVTSSVLRALGRGLTNETPTRAAANLWTGRQVNAVGNWALGLGGVGGAIGISALSYNAYTNWGVGAAYQQKVTGTVGYGGPLPSYSYDGGGVGKPYDLGATGDLVLGMHKGR